MTDPTIEIIIPTYGDPTWKETARTNALPSAYKQNGGSTVTANHAATLSAARNDPGLASEADYLVFLDADDELADDYITHAITTINATDPDIVIPNVQKVDADGTEHPPKQLDPGGWAYGSLTVVGAPIRTTLFQQLGGFREMEMYEDWDLFWTAHQHGATFVHNPNMIYRYRQTPTSRTRGVPQAKRIQQLHNVRIRHGINMGSSRP